MSKLASKHTELLACLMQVQSKIHEDTYAATRKMAVFKKLHGASPYPAHMYQFFGPALPLLFGC